LWGLYVTLLHTSKGVCLPRPYCHCITSPTVAVRGTTALPLLVECLVLEARGMGCVAERVGRFGLLCLGFSSLRISHTACTHLVAGVWTALGSGNSTAQAATKCVKPLRQSLWGHGSCCAGWGYCLVVCMARRKLPKLLQRGTRPYVSRCGAVATVWYGRHFLGLTPTSVALGRGQLRCVGGPALLCLHCRTQLLKLPHARCGCRPYVSRLGAMAAVLCWWHFHFLPCFACIDRRKR
jgi:hypothetical protein